MRQAAKRHCGKGVDISAKIPQRQQAGTQPRRIPGPMCMNSRKTCWGVMPIANSRYCLATPASLLAISRLTSRRLGSVFTRRHSCCGGATYALQNVSPERVAAAPKALPRNCGHADVRCCSWAWCNSLVGLSNRFIASDTLPARTCPGRGSASLDCH